MALHAGDGHTDTNRGLRISHFGGNRRHSERRVKSEDLRSASQFQALLGSSPAPDSIAPVAAPALSPVQLRTRGLNIQFGLVPAVSQEPCLSPRLEGDEWDPIEERTQLMAQLHGLQAEIAHLARRNNERIGVATSPVPLLAVGSPVESRRNSLAREWRASTSFSSSSDTLFDEDPEWPEADAFHDETGEQQHLVLNAADLQKLRDFRERHEAVLVPCTRPGVCTALRQLLVDFMVLGRALLSCAIHYKSEAAAAMVALLAFGAYVSFL